MTNLDDEVPQTQLPVSSQPGMQVSKSFTTNTSVDVTSILNHVVDAPPQTFIMFFLFFLVFYIVKTLAKFIDSKFIDTRMKTYAEKVSEGVASNTAHTNELQAFREEIKSVMNAAQASMNADLLKAQSELSRRAQNFSASIEDDLEKIKIALAKTNRNFNEGLPLVQEAIVKFQSEQDAQKKVVSNLDENFKIIVATIKKKGGE